MNKLFTINSKVKEIIIYIAFGVGTTLVNWVIYILLQLIFKYNNNFALTIYNGIAWLVAVTFAFFTNKIYVFRSKTFKIRVVLKEAIGFFLSRIATGVFDIFLPLLLINLGLSGAFMSIEGFWAKGISSIVVIILNYIFSKFLVFKKSNIYNEPTVNP